MKIILIKPNIGRKEHSLFVDEARMEPLQLGVIAGLTPESHEVLLYDDRVEAINYDQPADLVGITVETFTARRAYEIASAYRDRGVPVIMGGMHATLIPEEVADYADSVYVGDAEHLWGEVLDDLSRGKLKPLYKAKGGIPQIKSLPKRDLFAGKGYLPLSLLQFTRGCQNSCTFCATSAFFKQKYYHREVNDVVKEIVEQQLKLLFFVDDNIICDHEKAKELFRALIPLKIKWVSQASLDQVKDPELMSLMIKSGCVGNVVGFESINPSNMLVSRKGPNINRSHNYEDEIKTLHQHGLQTWAAFTLGYDEDTVEHIRQTTKFALRHRFTWAAFNILMPYPGTPLYSKLDLEQRLLYDRKWWLHPEYRFNHAAFLPKGMTPEELTEACFKARSRFNSIGSLIKRFFNFKTNLKSLSSILIYLTYARLFRKETFKKQGMFFGYTDKKITEFQKQQGV
ncbi:MAG: B12-binding domain-containing radical SAM protein [Proteobacteria bacterium]|nr:B12-binding domain-containing radical SAM protein [Pseudomonadota bacterium]